MSLRVALINRGNYSVLSRLGAVVVMIKLSQLGFGKWGAIAQRPTEISWSNYDRKNQNIRKLLVADLVF